MTWEEEFAKVQTIPKEDRGSFSMQASVRFWNVQLQQKSQQDHFFLKPACNLRQWPNRHLSCSQPAHSSAFFDKSWWQGMPIWNCHFSTFVGLACKKLTVT